MRTMIERIKSLHYWLIPIISVLVGELMVLSLLAQWSVRPWYRLYHLPEFRLLVQAFMSLALGMAFAVFVVKLVLNSWPWLARCTLRRYLAQALVGILGLGSVGYMYSDLFWRALGDSLLLLEHGGGIQRWAVAYLVMLNFAFVFMRLSVGFMNTGASPRDGYLKYLLAKERHGKEVRLSLADEVAYIQSFDGIQKIQPRTADRPLLEFNMSLERLAPKVDPDEYCKINRNYIVHWKAIRKLKREEKGRRLEVWLDPPTFGQFDPDTAGEVCAFVRKERAEEVEQWHRACLDRASSAL